jgi:hypothetical protein
MDLISDAGNGGGDTSTGAGQPGQYSGDEVEVVTDNDAPQGFGAPPLTHRRPMTSDIETES